MKLLDGRIFLIKDSILILSVSRKSLLCRWALKATKKYDLNLLGADVNPYAPALPMFDQVISLPSLQEPSFISELLQNIERFNIKLVIPTREEELLCLPVFREKIESSGCKLLCNTLDVTKEMIDKSKFALFCARQLGCSNLMIIASPEEAREEDFPLFFRWGKGQTALKVKIENHAALSAAFILCPEGVAITFLEGSEVSVDCYVSQEGQIIYIVPRTRDIILGGERIVTTTIESSVCCEVTEKLLLKAKIKGPAVLQGMLSEENFVPFEINLRFGGASVLSFQSAYSGIELAVREYMLGEKLASRFQYQPHLMLFKDFKETYILR